MLEFPFAALRRALVVLFVLACLVIAIAPGTLGATSGQTVRLYQSANGTTNPYSDLPADIQTAIAQATVVDSGSPTVAPASRTAGTGTATVTATPRGTPSGTVTAASGAALASPTIDATAAAEQTATADGLSGGLDTSTPMAMPSPTATATSPPPTATPLPHDQRYFAAYAFRVDDDRIWSFFHSFGGAATFGPPISRLFVLQGQPTQLFTMGALQIGADGQVHAANLLDPGLMPYVNFAGVSVPPADPALAASLPATSSPAYPAAVVSFLEGPVPDTIAGRQVGFHAYFMASVPAQPGETDVAHTLRALQVWGLPTSAPAASGEPGGYALRWQRGAMLYASACACTRQLPLGELLKGVLLGDAPADLQAEAAGSPLFAQYRPGNPRWLNRPGAAPTTDLTEAFRSG